MSKEREGSQESGLNVLPSTECLPMHTLEGSTHLLARVLTGSRSEHGHKLADEGTASPELTSLVEEGSDLGRNTTVPCRRVALMKHLPCIHVPWSNLPGRRTENETIKLLEVVRGDDRILGLERRTGMHLLQNLFGKSFLTVSRMCQHYRLPKLRKAVLLEDA